MCQYSRGGGGLDGRPRWHKCTRVAPVIVDRKSLDDGLTLLCYCDCARARTPDYVGAVIDATSVAAAVLALDHVTGSDHPRRRLCAAPQLIYARHLLTRAAPLAVSAPVPAPLFQPRQLIFHNKGAGAFHKGIYRAMTHCIRMHAARCERY